LTNNDFFERLRQSPHPVVVDFWAAWCGPCRMIEPALKSLEKQYDGRVDVWKVNADEAPELLRNLRIYGIPTLVSFKDGEEIARQTGVASPQVLSGLFEAAISGEKPARPPLSLTDRLVRLALGLALFVLAYSGGFSGGYLLVAGLGAVVLFSAVYDRCPIWQAVSSRLAALWGARRKN
jgi:thioredoxin 1